MPFGCFRDERRMTASGKTDIECFIGKGILMHTRIKDIFYVCLTGILILLAVVSVIREAGVGLKRTSGRQTEETAAQVVDHSGDAGGEGSNTKESVGKEAANGDGEDIRDEDGEIQKEDWKLILVNFENALPEDFFVELKWLDQKHAVDARCYDALQRMLEDCRKEGLEPLICSSYRTREKQESLFSNKVQRLLDQGYSYEDAVETGSGEVAVPGKSEHQTGLAVDIVDERYQLLDERQETTDVQKWLIANSWKYGFILRYPPKKSHITGIIYEPWHYRYVGKKAATEIHDKDICLEEYLQ